jgi:putative transposon-encoded protein
MRTIQIKKGDMTLKDEVEFIYERTITPFGTSAKIDAQKKWIGKRVYVLVLKD